ncbi:MAG: hypothetical protein KZQ64_11215 [gamma proteobacterium symbiont of Bathyaustriella thionipta]|nr:hypothetical protein [gamma proteobacterium symbiont of Bathyaustriella thionipta]MCU7950997.1 hypothetical protein [gamma proteobacterium symbiont of Bathyaustriella thionipta]MCU7953944.1 hypothetical protein [gamma proteobacterium symbiont of Bathyaustriella thionipta]MCU7957495.1 hypothetical protein [gamma proteobacterium symbiont of Bathyaustriella thionipta]MCU7966650.1 hypothetical protein [gamma proteobacterium symbiont of Bathyaustriella thionipta]
MIDTIKNNMNRSSRQTEKLTLKYSVRCKKYSVLLASLFLVACQTISKQGETGQPMNDTVQAPVEKDVVEKPVEEKISSQHLVKQQTSDKMSKSPKTDYSQSRTPMSAATKTRLKAHVQEINSNGSIPRVNYQQVITPGLQMKSADGQADKATPLQLDYEQVEIRQILEEFADSMEMAIIIDPSISGTVTMRTAPNSTLTQKDLWPLLQVLLTEAGVALEKRNGIYYAKRTQQYLPQTIGTSSILDSTDASLVMQVTPLKNISVDAAMTVLKPISGDKGRIVQVPNLNTLLIVDNPEQLKRVNGLLSLIDADPFKHRGIRLYKIKQAEAKNVAQELNDILKLIEGDKPAYQVMGLERINALLVVAPPGRGFKAVGRWVDILDAGADEALEEQIFIYKCKSMECSALAGTLNAIFEQEDKSVKKESEPKVDNPNEFKTVSKESLSVKEKNKQPVKETIKKKKRDGVVASADIKVTIVADEDSNALLVRTTAKDYKHLLETIRTLDVVPLEVLVNVVIAQVTLSDSQSFGIDWAYFGSSGTLIQTNFGQAQTAAGGEPLGLIVNRLTNNWRVTLNALAQESDVNILSRPSLLITNNQEGVINVGKEVPVETSNTTNTNSTTEDTFNVTQQIAYRKTGIELTVTPKINDDGIVSMAQGKIIINEKN